MLENNDATNLAELLDRLPCEIQLPDEWENFFSKKGVLPTVEDESRRWARMHFRTKAALKTTATLPAINRPPKTQVVYTRDISRGSISFLHAEQLYPGERCQVWLTDRRLRVNVERCNRVGPKCYVVGGTFE